MVAVVDAGPAAPSPDAGNKLSMDRFKESVYSSRNWRQSSQFGFCVSDLAWIITGGLIMSAVALVGGAFFHVLPQGMASLSALDAGIWLVAGCTDFLALEQFLHWHQAHRATAVARSPVNYLALACYLH